MTASALLLIRHGTTPDNLARRYGGRSDSPLSPGGQDQARALRARLSGLQIDGVHCSTLGRAEQTARIAFPAHEPRPHPDLREMHFGLWEGLTHEQALERFPDAYGAWVRDPLNAPIPEGETFKSFGDRVIRCALAIAREPGVHALVTHGGPVSLLLCHFEKRPLASLWSVAVPNASVFRVLLSGGGDPAQTERLDEPAPQPQPSSRPGLP